MKGTERTSRRSRKALICKVSFDLDRFAADTHTYTHSHTHTTGSLSTWLLVHRGAVVALLSGKPPNHRGLFHLGPHTPSPLLPLGCQMSRSSSQIFESFLQRAGWRLNPALPSLPYPHILKPLVPCSQLVIPLQNPLAPVGWPLPTGFGSYWHGCLPPAHFSQMPPPESACGPLWYLVVSAASEPETTWSGCSFDT